MAYLPSNAPIGPNSLQAPSACEVAASKAEIACAKMIAAWGRLETFLTVPPVSSFDSPTVAGDAARILNQSQIARASILGNGSPDTGPQGGGGTQSYGDAPEVVPLNGQLSTQVCGGSNRPQPQAPRPQMQMPQPAPNAVRVNGVQVYVQSAPLDTSWLQPSGGLTGYLPPWADAGLVDVAGPGGISGWLLGLLAVGGLVILGSAAGATRARRKRAYKR